MCVLIKTFQKKFRILFVCQIFEKCSEIYIFFLIRKIVQIFKKCSIFQKNCVPWSPKAEKPQEINQPTCSHSPQKKKPTCSHPDACVHACLCHARPKILIGITLPRRCMQASLSCNIVDCKVINSSQ